MTPFIIQLCLLQECSCQLLLQEWQLPFCCTHLLQLSSECVSVMNSTFHLISLWCAPLLKAALYVVNYCSCWALGSRCASTWCWTDFSEGRRSVPVFISAVDEGLLISCNIEFVHIFILFLSCCCVWFFPKWHDYWGWSLASFNETIWRLATNAIYAQWNIIAGKVCRDHQ